MVFFSLSSNNFVFFDVDIVVKKQIKMWFGAGVVLKQIDVSFSCVCPVIGHEFCHKIVKVAVDPRDDSRRDLQGDDEI